MHVHKHAHMHTHTHKVKNDSRTHNQKDTIIEVLCKCGEYNMVSNMKAGPNLSGPCLTSMTCDYIRLKEINSWISE